MFAVLIAASIWNYFFATVLFLLSLFLILLVLVQRGRGGGLTGALGGMGGQSAFGAKAGDTFTRVTMVTATIWILTCMAAIKVLGTQDNWGASGDTRPGITAPATDDLGGGEESELPGGTSGEATDDGAGGGAGDGLGAVDSGSGDVAPGDAGPGEDAPASSSDD
jgi:preprotein translocase subunit SecG